MQFFNHNFSQFFCGMMAFAMLSVPSAVESLPFEARTYDGTNNNPLNSDAGKAGGPMIRKTDEYGISPKFTDGSTPDYPSFPNARTVTNILMDQNKDHIYDKRGMTDQTTFWGQLLAHEISLTLTDSNDPMNIIVPPGDPDFGDNAIIRMSRSVPISGTGDSINNPRKTLNQQTSFIDASVIYGFDEGLADSLRTFVDGKMKTSTGNLLPKDGDNFLAGDPRANENFALIALQTLFVREHNRLADLIKDARPDWNDEEIYQGARKIVGALMQAITYNEYLPALGVKFGKFRSYNPNLDPHAISEVVTVGFRMGHSQSPQKRLLIDADGNKEFVLLSDTFFNPAGFTPEVMDQILRGGSYLRSERIDLKVVDEIRSRMIILPFGILFLDLAAVDIQRTRDRGIWDYNTVREAFGLPRLNNYKEITNNKKVRRQLKNIYGSMDHIDLFTGVLAEDHLRRKSVSETVFVMLKEQFKRLRNGDRFWYENDPAFLPGGDLANMGFDIRYIKRRTYSKVIVENTGIDSLPRNVFKIQQQGHRINQNMFD